MKIQNILQTVWSKEFQSGFFIQAQSNCRTPFWILTHSITRTGIGSSVRTVLMHIDLIFQFPLVLRKILSQLFLQ
ncbi:Uncharacterised protein [Mycobacterium tuberculosis]|uniref:Uncharacterized protein n=1 Tax=Mycobacterium tuberculosis TaxID=1773 RepID=A0A655ARX2_MYCTX|nr:Uncharacterised protein [Mycobacterium tuberculosis]